MLQTSTYKLTLLTLLITLFTVNSVLASGVCCLDHQSSENTLSAHAPCHSTDMGHTADIDNNNDNHHCASCIATALPITLSIHNSEQAQDANLFAPIFFTSNDKDPLFKPPNLHLS